MKNLQKEDESVWCVYYHRNKINGKIYIGITKQKPEKRWNNGKGYNYNTYFYSSILKYGWDNFEHEVLIDELTKYEATNIEIELILKYKTMEQEFGYNLTSGGDGCDGFKHTQETKEKLRLSKFGKENPLYGIRRSEETKKKLKLVNIGREHTEKERRKRAKSLSKPIVQLTIDGKFIREWESAKEVNTEYGYNNSHIRECCLKKGGRKTSNGFIWMSLEEYVEKTGGKNGKM